MTTTSDLIKSSDGWVQIGSGDADFTVSVQPAGYDLIVAFSAEEPVSDYGHRIVGGGTFKAEKLTGNLWARTDSPDDIRYIVTRGLSTMNYRNEYVLGLLQSGTFNAGDAEHCTVSPVFPGALVGLSGWFYIPAVATTPAITAGNYFIDIVSNSTITVYTDGPGSEPFDFSSGAVAFSGVINTDITLDSKTVPGGTFTKYTRFRGFLRGIVTASTNLKYHKIFISQDINFGMIYQKSENGASVVTVSQTFNAKAPSTSRILMHGVNGVNGSSTVAAGSISTIDLAQDSVVSVVLQRATATELCYYTDVDWEIN